MSFDPNICSLAELDAEIIDQASVICHLFFSSRLPMKRIATILDISTVRVERVRPPFDVVAVKYVCYRT